MSNQEKIDEIYERIDKVEEKFDFSADKRIDINNLHTELQLQSETAFKYNKRRAKLSAVVEDLEELKKQTRSQLINKCIADPKLCDPDSATPKYSVQKAETYYRLDSGYKEVVDALLNARYEHDAMAGMQRIIEDQKWLLKDLVALSMSQYFESSETKETRIVHSADSEHLAEIDEAIKDSGKKEPILTGTTCAECGEPQFETTSGITCKNGHGGADSATEPDKTTQPPEKKRRRRSKK